MSGFDSSLMKPGVLYLPSFSSYLTWIVSLLFWLWGCKLAELADRDAEREVSHRTIWIWRIAAWGAAALLPFSDFTLP